MKTQKHIKIILIIIAALTVAAAITAIVMLNAVSGDNLLYMDSNRGNIYALSYRWVSLASGILILFWVIMGIYKRAFIIEEYKKFRVRLEEQKQYRAMLPVESVIEEPPKIEKTEKNVVFCTNCGKPRPRGKPFCPFCGTPAKSVKEAEVTEKTDEINETETQTENRIDDLL